MAKIYTKSGSRRPPITAKSLLLVIAPMILAAGTILIATKFNIIDTFATRAGGTVVEKTVANNGSEQWADDKQVTIPQYAFSESETAQLHVAPLFTQYYESRGGARSLGEPITTAFPTQQGWMQFFRSGALLLPTKQQKQEQATQNPLAVLGNDSSIDPKTGIVRFCLLQPLLTLGSRATIGGQGSPMSYVELRQASAPQNMRPAPGGQQGSGLTFVSHQGVFIKEGTRGEKEVGHFISQAFWNYINSTDVAPDGWMKDFGLPLTEALPFTVTIQGQIHHMVTQVFTNDGLLMDQDARDQAGQPLIQRITTGLDYLRTVGPPPVAIEARQSIWSQEETGVLNAPGNGQAVAHVGVNFPLTLLGESNWVGGTLWYHVSWSVPKKVSTGWVAGGAVTFTQPGNGSVRAGIDTLSPGLASYLSGIGNNVGVVVYDMTGQRYYSYNGQNQFMMASSVKVPIMLTFFDMIESQGRGATDDEMNLLTTMIENSNNDSASALYYNEIGGAQGMSAYMQKIGIAGVNPNPDAWGYTTVTPQAMVDMLTLLQEGKILNDQDRATALNLMENIESDQQVGVGDTAPNGATVAMKDGWVTDPDDLWVMNSSGIVSIGKETYIIAVYTQGQQSLDDGHTIAERVCSTVAGLLA